jgi:hypothetical protein
MASGEPDNTASRPALWPISRIAEDHVSIIRLLGGRQDWVSILKAADL